jgi:hypothetical protein
MDSLNGKFNFDPIRRKDAADEHRLSEVKTKLIFSAERKLRPYLLSVAGAKILSTKVDRLDITEDEESGAPLLSGKVITDVSFFDGKVEKIASIPVAVLDGQPEVVQKDVDAAFASAAPAQIAPVAASSSVVTASLNDFKVVDDGTRYLKIYHTAAYGDLEPIGAVSKDEYVAADKKTLLSEMLKDEAVSWPADVNFVGEFAEPTILEAAMTEKPHYVVKAYDNVSNESTSEEDMTWAHKTADKNRLAAEAAQKTLDDLKSRVTQRALSAFTDAWKTRGTGSVKIKNTTSTWEPQSGVGDITIEAEVLDGKEMKLVPFTVAVNGNTMRLPDFAQLSSMLKEAKVVSREVQGENIHKNVVLEKKATPMAPSRNNYQEVVRMPKDFLPASLKVGDVIEVDGLRYKLASKSEGQLSNQKDSASYWLFERCMSDEKPIYRQEAY